MTWYGLIRYFKKSLQQVPQGKAIFSTTMCLCISFRIQRDDKHLNQDETSNWSLEGGFLDNKAKETFPRRALDSGASSGLTIFIYMENENIDPICSFSIHGVKVSIILSL